MIDANHRFIGILLLYSTGVKRNSNTTTYITSLRFFKTRICPVKIEIIHESHIFVLNFANASDKVRIPRPMLCVIYHKFVACLNSFLNYNLCLPGGVLMNGHDLEKKLSLLFCRLSPDCFQILPNAN